MDPVLKNTHLQPSGELQSKNSVKSTCDISSLNPTDFIKVKVAQQMKEVEGFREIFLGAK